MEQIQLRKSIWSAPYTENSFTRYEQKHKQTKNKTKKSRDETNSLNLFY